MTVIRRSPVVLPGLAAETETRFGFQVVVAFQEEKPGNALVDVSHLPKWDVQHGRLDDQKVFGVFPPAAPGEVVLTEDLIVNRLNATQVSVFDLSTTERTPPESFYTETTDGLALIALTGPDAFSIMERAAALDLTDPGLAPPFVVQGPVWHVPCQVVVLSRGEAPLLLIGFSRGYGRSLVEAILAAGAPFRLLPAGEGRFRKSLSLFAE